MRRATCAARRRRTEVRRGSGMTIRSSRRPRLRLRSRICLIRSAGAGIGAPLVVVGSVTRYGSESKRMRKVTLRQPFVFISLRAPSPSIAVSKTKRMVGKRLAPLARSGGPMKRTLSHFALAVAFGLLSPIVSAQTPAPSSTDDAALAAQKAAFMGLPEASRKAAQEAL